LHAPVQSFCDCLGCSQSSLKNGKLAIWIGWGPMGNSDQVTWSAVFNLLLLDMLTSNGKSGQGAIMPKIVFLLRWDSSDAISISEVPTFLILWHWVDGIWLDIGVNIYYCSLV
jgi:hypothetical protein